MSMCKIDWAKIYKNEFLFFEKCYTECGSYCCKNELNGEYALLKRKSVVLPMLEGEYAYYKSQGGISKLQASKVKKEVFSLKDKALTLYYLTCDCFGECNPHCLRPLLCRMYPYFPSVDLEGRILGFLPISLLDVFFSDTSAHKCTLVRDKNAEVQAQLSKSLKPLLEIPLFIFIFKAMEILVRYLREYMESIFATSIASAGGGGIYR